MENPTICIGENKGAVTAKLISAFVFASRIVQCLFYLNQKFQASNTFLCLYRSVCVGPVRKPHCWFSHEAAHLSCILFAFMMTKDYLCSGNKIRPNQYVSMFGRQMKVPSLFKLVKELNEIPSIALKSKTYLSLPMCCFQVARLTVCPTKQCWLVLHSFEGFNFLVAISMGVWLVRFRKLCGHLLGISCSHGLQYVF